MFNRYQMEELEPSWANQLDKTGMQPHSREYLECEIHTGISAREFQVFEGQVIDYCPGIQFSGSP